MADKPYTCAECGKRFPNEFCLAHHFKVHEKDD
jgi:hypothetical protein